MRRGAGKGVRAANLTVMERTPGSGRKGGGMTPLLSLGLAVLVAATLVAFSVLALRTGFTESPRHGVATRGAGRTDAAPLVLPSSSPGATKARTPARSEGTVAQVAAEGEATNAVALRTRARRNQAASTPISATPEEETDEIDNRYGDGRARASRSNRDDDETDENRSSAHGKSRGHEDSSAHGKSRGHEDSSAHGKSRGHERDGRAGAHRNHGQKKHGSAPKHRKGARERRHP